MYYILVCHMVKVLCTTPFVIFFPNSIRNKLLKIAVLPSWNCKTAMQIYTAWPKS